VTADSVIVRLDNPELSQNESCNLAEMTARYETAALNRQAEEKLIEKGIVSQLAYQESVLEEQQLVKRIAILQQRIEQLKLVHKESINIQQERLKQQQV
jgi:HlyD family secretion protein